ncbi:hypothetical protein CD932_18340, partial [Janthinobacterium sp. PC23-8]
SQTTQQNASSSEELAATAEEMSSQAEQLQQTMSFFKLGSGTPATARASAPRQAAARRQGTFRTAAPAAPVALAPHGGPDEQHFTRF